MEATLGGAESMYPELARKIQREKNAPAAKTVAERK
jgi:hypothetical protein